MIRTRRHIQRGATLLISLVMLVILTLFAITGFNLTNVNLKIAGNFQQQRHIEMVVQQAVEQAISNINTFTPVPAAQTITVDGIAVSITAAACRHSTIAIGYELNYPNPAPEDNIWELRASASDAFGGAKAVITQGISMRMLPRNCT